MRIRYLVLVVVLSLMATATIVVGFAQGTEPGGFDYSRSHFTPSSVEAFSEFPLYWLGSDFQSEPLTAIHRRTGDARSRAPSRPNYVSFKYGTCVSTDGSGCAPPLEIQIWPACRLNRSSYHLVPDLDGNGPQEAVPYPREDLTLRGVPAAFYESARSLQLYTGDVTVVVFGRTRDQLLTAAVELRGANLAVAAVEQEDSLPAPVIGALDGLARCP